MTQLKTYSGHQMKGMFWHPVLLIRGEYIDIQRQFGGIVCKFVKCFLNIVVHW